MHNNLPDTINFHFTSQCNANCIFCFAKYNNLKSKCCGSTVRSIIDLLSMESADFQPKRINFVGGEPTVDKRLLDFCIYAKKRGLTTSIVTNGFIMLKNGFEPFVSAIDQLGISIDSIIPAINVKTGRYDKKNVFIPEAGDWLRLAEEIHRYSKALKINTVVHQLNKEENLAGFISTMAPDQWKIFQVSKIEGQNDAEFNAWRIDEDDFNIYCRRQLSALDHDKSIRLSTERSSEMINSYAMIGPNGCFVDNSNEKYSYSEPILEVGLRKAWEQISFSQTAWHSRRANHASLQLKEAVNG